MSDSFNIAIEGELPALLEKLRLFPGKVNRAASQGLYVGAQRVEGFIVRERLTGQGPFPPSEHRLGQKTGRLRQSVRTTRPEINGGEISVQIGTNVKYAGVHEFGFDGTVQVRAFSRKRKEGNRYMLKGATKDVPYEIAAKVGAVGKRGGGIRGAKLTFKASSQVKAHTRHMRFPARRMFATGLQEHGNIITEGVQKALETLWEEVK